MTLVGTARTEATPRIKHPRTLAITSPRRVAILPTTFIHRPLIPLLTSIDSVLQVPAVRCIISTTDRTKINTVRSITSPQSSMPPSAARTVKFTWIHADQALFPESTSNSSFKHFPTKFCHLGIQNTFIGMLLRSWPGLIPGRTHIACSC